MKPLTISLAQMNIQLGQPQANLMQLREWLEKAAYRQSSLILLPELWTTGYDLSNAVEHAMTNRALLPEIAALAQRYQIAIGGSLLLEHANSGGADSGAGGGADSGANGVYNTFVLQSPAGEQARYEKVHLFQLMEEDRWLAAGDHLQTVDTAWGRAGLSVCYDLRFPEMFRRYALSGVELILICAEWPAVRVAHWKTLLRARAIENQCFMVAANAVGQTGAETFAGSSAVISPWGETLVEGTATGNELLTVTIDMDTAAEAREKIPVFKDRREELY